MSKSNVESIDTAAELVQAERESSLLAAKEQELRKALAALRGRWWNDNRKDKPNKPDGPAVDEAQRIKLEKAVEALLRGEEPSADLLATDSLEVRIAATLRKLEIIRPAVVQAARRSAELRERHAAATLPAKLERLRREAEEMRALEAQFIEAALAYHRAWSREAVDFDSLPADCKPTALSMLAVRVATEQIQCGLRKAAA